jgi:hypothetical protein
VKGWALSIASWAVAGLLLIWIAYHVGYIVGRTDGITWATDHFYASPKPPTSAHFACVQKMWTERGRFPFEYEVNRCVEGK